MTIIDNVVVEYPQGAGGAFLSTVLACCITNCPWEQRKINFHRSPVKTQGNHWCSPANNIISIDDAGAKFNFWIYYYKKRVVHELTHYRHQQRRWVKCPYENIDSRGDAFWLLNQVNFIISYQSQQSWKISWGQMLEKPNIAWQTIQEFLEDNHQPNCWNLEKWLLAVNHYRKTLPNKVYINPFHTRWQIWAIALLQTQGIVPEFDIVDNFGKPIFKSWLENYNKDLIDQTQKLIWTPG